MVITTRSYNSKDSNEFKNSALYTFEYSVICKKTEELLGLIIPINNFDIDDKYYYLTIFINNKYTVNASDVSIIDGNIRINCGDEDVEYVVTLVLHEREPFRRERFKDKSVEVIFTEIYTNKEWAKESDSISGKGSSLEHTTNSRKLLPLIFENLEIKSLIDLGCGDLFWFKDLLPYLNKYRGVDIVYDLIQKNIKTFTDEKANFVTSDVITYNDFDNFDAVMLKDVLVHLKEEQIITILDNIKKSNVKYLIATSFTNTFENLDIETHGDWRPIKLSDAPFNLGDPINIIKETSEKYIFLSERLNDKTLSIWKLW